MLKLEWLPSYPHRRLKQFPWFQTFWAAEAPAILLLLVASSLPAGSAFATIISPTSLTPVATVLTRGEYDNRDLGYWNGEPLSSTNHPTEEQDQLSATWNFYVNPKMPNELFLVVSDVLDTDFGYITGEPFDLVALTGVEFSFKTSPSIGLGAFSSQYVVGGEGLVGPSSNYTALTNTPGWTESLSVSAEGTQTYDLQASGVNYGFTHFSDVYGETRIYGGGVFAFTFKAGTDLFNSINFTKLSLDASNGEGQYSENGQLVFSYTPANVLPGEVPEPGAWNFLIIGVASVGWILRRARPTVVTSGYSSRNFAGTLP